MDKLLIPVWQKILVNLNEKDNQIMWGLMTNTGVSYDSIQDNIKKLEKQELVKTKKNGRTRTITITKKGKEVAESLKVGLKEKKA